MDKKLQSILDHIPEGPPRSKLEPYRDFIRNLRQRRKTYRQIAGILAEQCNLHVQHSTIYDFIHATNRGSDEIPVQQPQPLPRVLPVENIMTIGGLPGRVPPTPAQDLQARIAAIKQRKSTTQAPEPVFHYEEGEPLRLISDPKSKEQRR